MDFSGGLLPFCFFGCVRGNVCSNGLLGVRFNLFLVVVARFTGLRGKPSVVNLITKCKKAAAVACSLDVAPYNR